jgi:nitrogen fixation protein FixH
MKKLNWGTGITIVIILFLVVTIGQVLVIHYLVDYDLVVEEYYDAEIKYQVQIDKIKRANNLPEQLQIKFVGNAIEFKFPLLFEPQSISGIINYYKPSNDLLDKFQEIKLNKENKMFFKTKELSTGLWKIKVDWAANDVQYYNEKIMMVP